VTLQRALFHNTAIDKWQPQHGRAPILSKHNPAFAWTDRDQLVNSVAFGLPLIAPEKTGNNSAESTNLVAALRAGVSGFPRMPILGPYLADAEIHYSLKSCY
jgi:hypothetical protein